MSDKFRKTAPLSIQFSDGEGPTAKKLNAVATQARNGTDLLEQAIGDIWSQSGDASLSDNPLQIPNLARMIGEGRYMNPSIYPTGTTFEYEDQLGTSYEGFSEGYFLYAPTEGTTGAGGLPATYTIVDDTPGNFVNQVLLDSDVNAAGEFWVEAGTGKFRVFGEIDGGPTTVRYQVNASGAWVGRELNRPGVIPDPRQGEFLGVRFELSSGKYFLHLPPRRPLTFGVEGKPTRYPGVAFYTDNEDSSVQTPPKLWQYATAALTGANSEHYRYRLPAAMLDTFAGLAAGEVLPSGFFQLWDQTNQTVVEGIVFKKPSIGGFQNYTLEVESTGELDLSTLTTASEVEADYNSGYSLITAGSSLASRIQTVENAFLNHAHRNTGSLEPPVNHKDLAGLNPSGTDGSHFDGYPNYLPTWPASFWEADDHTYLLSRAGSTATAADLRDPNNNAMIGDLVIANSVAVAGVFLDDQFPDDTFSIKFGDTGGPIIHGSVVFDAITASGLDNTQTGFVGVGTFNDTATIIGGNGLEGYGAGGGQFAAGGHGGVFVAGTSGATTGAGGDGVRGTGATGTSSDGYGVRGSGAGSSAGVYGIGGGSAGIGVLGNGTAGGHGMLGVGNGSGTGIQASGGTTGWGVNASSAGTTKSALHLAPQASDPGTVASGDIYVNTDTGKPKFHDGVTWNRPPVQTYTAIVDGTGVSSTTTETGFDNLYQIPADALTIGSVIKVRFLVSCTADSVPANLTVALRYGASSGASPGGTALFTISGITLNVGSTINTIVDAQMTMRSIGPAGAINGSYMFDTNDAQGFADAVSASIDTETASNLVVSVDWSSAAGGSSASLTSFVIEIT